MTVTYTSLANVRALTSLDSNTVSDANLTIFINLAESEIDKWYMPDGRERTNLIFASNTETSELIDYRVNSKLVRTIYPFITSITSLYYNQGDGTYQVKTQGITNDFYSSVQDMVYGVIRFNTTPIFEQDSIKVTYVHGFSTIPTWVNSLCSFIAAKKAYNAALEVGQEDLFKERQSYLDSEIDKIKKDQTPIRRGYVVI